MANTFIRQRINDVNIEQYPKTLEPHQGSLTLGDLHGNPVKLLYSLIRHQVFKFKAGINPEQAYAEFVALYNDSGNLTTINAKNQEEISSRIRFLEIFIENHNALLVSEWTQNLASLTDVQNTQERIASIVSAQTEIAVQKENIVRLNTQVKEKFPAIIARFNAFLDQLELARKPELIRLVGDELADRGKNDYFMLGFMNYFKAKDVHFSITISNHSNEFITFTEGEQDYLLSPHYRPSLAGLKLLLDNGIVAKTTLDDWVNKAYKPNIKAIDYQLVDGNPPSIRLFTHAPVRFDIIEKIANKLGVGYQDGTANELAQSIDSINAALAEHIQAGTMHTLRTLPSDIDPANLSPQQVEQYPLIYLIWNRWNPVVDQDETARPAEKKGFFDATRYKLEYYHGHDGAFSKSPHVFNLDNGIGKNEVSDDELITQLSSAEEELQKCKRQMADIDTKRARGELSPAVADAQKQSIQHHINGIRAAINGFHYTAFSADSKGLAAPKRSFFDRIPGFNALRVFFSDVVQGVATVTKTVKRYVSALREEVFSRTDPDHKTKQTFAAVMIQINEEVGKYNAAADRLKLYAGGVNKYSAEELKADMQKMLDVVSNLKKIELPARAEEIAERYYRADPNNRVAWSKYKECMMIREGTKTPELLFNKINEKLKQQPQAATWPRAPAHEQPPLPRTLGCFPEQRRVVPNAVRDLLKVERSLNLEAQYSG